MHRTARIDQLGFLTVVVVVVVVVVVLFCRFVDVFHWPWKASKGSGQLSIHCIVIWLKRDVLVTKRAAAFCAGCNLQVDFAWRPYSRLLQKWSPPILKAWTKVRVVSKKLTFSVSPVLAELVWMENSWKRKPYLNMVIEFFGETTIILGSIVPVFQVTQFSIITVSAA